MGTKKPQPRRVVALGSSAGGLPALETFFDEVADDTGFAFVVLSHRSEGPSILGGLLQRHTSMPVVDVSDAPVQLVADHVYIAPAQKLLGIAGGELRTNEIATDSVRYPIDFFFRSLAADQGPAAVAIVLSGGGSDGTRGIEAVKGADGVVAIQNEADALHGAMPHAALAVNLHDFCLPIPELAAKVSALSDVPSHVALDQEEDAAALERMFDRVSAVSGIDFSVYKATTVQRRIARRMAVNTLASFRDYVELVLSDSVEAEELARDLLIGVTSFFRDPESWDALAASIDTMLEQMPDLDVVRAWVAGCSTGEEAYTLAMVLDECRDRSGRRFDTQIFATDVNHDAIQFARQGAYPPTIAEDVGAERFARFFRLDDDRAVIDRNLRERIVFAPHDMLSDPPFSHLHIVTCRNVLIYFDTEVQNEVLGLFQHGLTHGGLLFLGGSESLGPRAPVFDDVDSSHKLFRRTGAAAVTTNQLVRPFARPTRRRVAWAGARTTTLSTAERLLLEAFTPPSVIVDGQGHVMYVHGRTGRFLEPAPGPQSSVNVFDMARDGLQFDLINAHRQALEAPGEHVTQLRIPVRANGDWIAVDVHARAITQDGVYDSCVLLSFQESPLLLGYDESEGGEARITELEEQLRNVQQSRQSFVEELQTANEELKSTNEELQSTNEELQSANEELETSREEMQLLNEELRTVNDELRTKIGDVVRSNDDMANLINATDVATVFVDTELRVVSFTPSASGLIKLIPSDAGRPIGDLTSRISAPIVDVCRSVLESLVFKEREVQHDDGRWYAMRVHPYRTAENLIDGLVISFIDVTEHRGDRLRLDHTNAVLAPASAGVVGWDSDGVHRWTLGAPFGLESDIDPLGADSPLGQELIERLTEIRDEACAAQQSREDVWRLDEQEGMRVVFHTFTNSRSQVEPTMFAIRLSDTESTEGT